MNADMPPSRTKYIDWPSLAMAIAPLLAIGVDAWGVVYYRQGRRNVMLDFAPSAIGVAIVLSLAIAGLLVRGYVLVKRGDARTTFFWLLVPLMLMVWPAAWAMRPTPIEVYRRGLVDWAAENVDASELRAWHARMRPVTSPTLVRGAISPLAVSRLNPTLIEQHPNGLLLQWGTRATLPGRERKVFIGIDDATQPPDEGRRFWRPARPGVYVGAHGPP
jgi:hypothetical protein